MSNWVKGHSRPWSWPLQWPSSSSPWCLREGTDARIWGSAALEDACFLRSARRRPLEPWRLLKRPPHPTLLLGKEEKEEHLHHRSQAGVPKLCKSFPSKAINLNEGWGTNVLEQKASNFHMKYRRFYSWIRSNEPSFLPNFQGWVFTSLKLFFATFISYKWVGNKVFGAERRSPKADRAKPLQNYFCQTNFGSERMYPTVKSLILHEKMWCILFEYICSSALV